ncbi:Detected protein of unknown function [Hibiscus syriacus]|uniref:Uncharacterized protein n=1 Tax=Hibiscus syriacus TaxID=106335 RepID=A0A6A3AAN4_HIBSY|nr:Detected protein of unknown function [Hibiscus syriacus]
MATVAANSTAVAQACSTWHSPVPYLFGAFFYCRRLTDRLLNAGGGGDGGRDDESGGNDGGSKKKKMKVFEENILVIMAGDERPTFLATPVSTKAPSFGDLNGGGGGSEKAESGGDNKPKEEDTRNPN